MSTIQQEDAHQIPPSPRVSALRVELVHKPWRTGTGIGDYPLGLSEVHLRRTSHSPEASVAPYAVWILWIGSIRRDDLLL
jgi:hypothetical protein